MQENKKILIVDDDHTLSAMLQEMLTISGCECTCASSGKAALELLKNGSFDMMVTDIVMPGMDGFELTEKVRYRLPDLPVIVMTGFSEEDSYDRAVAAGAADFIKKPFNVKELLVRIDRITRDNGILSEIRRREDEIRTISREMIAGVQDEARKRLVALQAEIKALQEKLH